MILMAALLLCGMLQGTVLADKAGPYHQEVQEMIELVHTAAKRYILPRFGKVEIKEKTTKNNFKDLVTQADIDASNYILDTIRKKFPGSYSEEQKHSDRFEHELIWQIDPVDGTQEFCEGFAQGYTTLATLLKRQKNGNYWPVASVIYQPVYDKTWYNDGSDKVICLHNGRRKKLPKFNRSVIRGYQRKVDHMSYVVDGYHLLGKRLNLPVQVGEFGGAGAGLIALLEGKANLLLMNSDATKDWDLAPAIPMVKALGGFVCDLAGNKFVNLNRENCKGMDEPYNLRGYAVSFVFKQDEVIPYLPPVEQFMDYRLIYNQAKKGATIMTRYMAHRVNSSEELKNIDKAYGVELDLRDVGDRIILRHDPFTKGDEQDFEEYLKHYDHGLMILNVKSERIEHKVLELVKKYNVKDYFFLDSSFPMIKLLSFSGEPNIAVRYSELEGLDTVLAMKDKVKWVWVDCFTQLPITHAIYKQLKDVGFNLCLVSPELQGRDEDIEKYARYINDEGIVFDAICTKVYNIDRWKKLLAVQAHSVASQIAL